MTNRSVSYFDYSAHEEKPSGFKLREDIDTFREKIHTPEEAAALMERIKEAIEHIDASLAAPVSPEEAHSDRYLDWRQRSEYSKKRYQGAFSRIDGHRHSLISRELNRQRSFKKSRLEEASIAAQRKLDEAAINTLYQTSKARAFITILKDRGLVPTDVWRELWDEAEQLAFDNRSKFEAEQRPKLEAKVKEILAEIDKLNQEGRA